MLKPDFGFHERQLSNVFVLATAANAGTLMTRDTSDVSVVGVGDCNYGRVVAGSVALAGDAELGCLYYDVTTNGPTFFNIVSGVLDLTTAVNGPVTIWHFHKNAIFSTDSFKTTSTGAIVAGQASGNTAPDTLLGILNGQYVVASAFTPPAAGSAVRAKLIGNAVVNGVQCIRVMAL